MYIHMYACIYLGLNAATNSSNSISPSCDTSIFSNAAAKSAILIPSSNFSRPVCARVR